MRVAGLIQIPPAAAVIRRTRPPYGNTGRAGAAGGGEEAQRGGEDGGEGGVGGGSGTARSAAGLGQSTRTRGGSGSGSGATHPPPRHPPNQRATEPPAPGVSHSALTAVTVTVQRLQVPTMRQ